MEDDRIILRSATVDDIPILTDLTKELGHPNSEEEILRRFIILQQYPEHQIIVAECEGNVIGLMSFHPLDLLFGDGKLGRITALVVSEAERGKGIGKMLVAKAEELAKKSGCRRIEVTSGIHRTEAHRFYESVGFQANSKRFIKKIAN